MHTHTLTVAEALLEDSLTPSALFFIIRLMFRSSPSPSSHWAGEERSGFTTSKGMLWLTVPGQGRKEAREREHLCRDRREHGETIS